MIELLDNILSWGTLFNALTLGAIYALIAVGYTMVYGIIQLINFAHGEVFMLGTYAGLLLVAQANVPLAGAVLLAMALCAVLGAVIDFTAYLPLRRVHPLADGISIVGLVGVGVLTIAYFEAVNHSLGGLALALAALVGVVPLALFAAAVLGLVGRLGRPKATVTSDRLSALITAIGISLTLQTCARLLFGADFEHFPDRALPAFLDMTVLEAGGAALKGKEVVTWGAALVLMGGLNYMVARTKIGKAMRACAQDKATASLMGINVNYVIAITFMVGSALAAVAGILYAIKVGGNIYFRMGYTPGVIAFAAAVLGGIGSIRGAVAGGFLIGITQAIGQVIKAEYDFAFAFGLMILVILFRPWGLFGRAQAARA